MSHKDAPPETESQRECREWWQAKQPHVKRAWGRSRDGVFFAAESRLLHEAWEASAESDLRRTEWTRAEDFRSAVLNELIIDGIYRPEHEDTPVQALQDAIQWNVDVALDARVSALARREVRLLGDGKHVKQKQMLAELADLGPGWRLETPHELFALRSRLTHKNAKGAHSTDDSIELGYYWTDEKTPWGGRVVVGFHDGFIGHVDAGDRAFARAVRAVA